MGIVDKITSKLAGNESSGKRSSTSHTSTHESDDHDTHHDIAHGGNITEGTVIDPNPDIGAYSNAGYHSKGTKTGTVSGKHGQQAALSHPKATTTSGSHFITADKALARDYEAGSGFGTGEFGSGSTSSAAYVNTSAGNTERTDRTFDHSGSTVLGGSTGKQNIPHLSGKAQNLRDAHETGTHPSSGTGSLSGMHDSRDKDKVNDEGKPIVEKNFVTSEVRHEKNKGNTMIANLAQTADELDRKTGRVFGKKTLTGTDKGLGTGVLHKKEEKEVRNESVGSHQSQHHGSLTTHENLGSTGHESSQRDTYGAMIESNHGKTPGVLHGSTYGITTGTNFDSREAPTTQSGSHPTTIDDVMNFQSSERSGHDGGLTYSQFDSNSTDRNYGVSFSNTKDHTVDTSVPVKSTNGLDRQHGQTDRENHGSGHFGGFSTMTSAGLHDHDASLNTPRSAGLENFATGNSQLDEKVASLNVQGQQRAKDAYNKDYQDAISHAH